MTSRTVRLYTAGGLLPPPDIRGQHALYTDDHLSRIRLIQRLKEAFLPLLEIRAPLEAMSTQEIAGLANADSRPLEEAAEVAVPPHPRPARRRRSCRSLRFGVKPPLQPLAGGNPLAAMLWPQMAARIRISKENGCLLR